MSDTQFTPLDFAQVTTPGTPSSGFVRLYSRPDGNIYATNSEGVESGLSQASVSAADVQQVFINQTPELTYPALSFSSVTIGDEEFFEMKVNVP